MKLKETLNLGKTAFPMRAGLPNKEPIWQKEWEDAKMYQRRQELNQGKPHFTLHDGPPYANGNIHVGHAMNKISKDIIVRSKSMSGFYAPYVPGWDTHGLPIEQVLAKQGVKRKELDRAEYLKMCRDYALSQVDKQREDFKRLGVSADWDNPYVTLTPDYEAAQIRVFGGMAKKGYIYQGAKPVYWSWSSESALAEAEIEYHDLVSTSLYYANKVKDGKGVLDTDTYNECDDQFALAYLLKSQERFNIEAITVAPYHHDNNISIIEGNEKSYNEIIKICKYLNFDTTNKVYKGSEDYLQNNYNETTKAVEKIIEIALKNEKTYILSIGAITNIAIAILKEPKIIDRIEIIWLGGNSLLQNKNDEFNFRQDIKAVKTIFESNAKLTIIPCKNVASNLITSIYELEHFLKGKNELCDYLCQRFYNDGVHGIQERRVIWDISVIAYMLNKSWFMSEEISCPRIREDSSYELTNNNHKITMINYIDVNKVYTDLFNKLTK